MISPACTSTKPNPNHPLHCPKHPFSLNPANPSIYPSNTQPINPQTAPPCTSTKKYSPTRIRLHRPQALVLRIQPWTRKTTSPSLPSSAAPIPPSASTGLRRLLHPARGTPAQGVRDHRAPNHHLSRRGEREKRGKEKKGKRKKRKRNAAFAMYGI